jgi:TAT (twin-arginine translocation) pathway signal sequence
MMNRSVRTGVPFPVTRRNFLKAGTATTLAMLTASFGSALPQTVFAAGDDKKPADPRPIPYGTPWLYPDPTIGPDKRRTLSFPPTAITPLFLPKLAINAVACFIPYTGAN